MAPPKDYRAQAEEKERFILGYRDRGRQAGPTFDPSDPKGIVEELKKLSDDKAMAAEWKALKADAACLDEKQQALLAGAPKETLFANLQSKLVSDVKELKDKTTVTNDLKPIYQPYLDVLDKFVASGTEEEKAAATKIKAKYVAELPKFHGEHHDAEMKRIDESLGKQKAQIMSERAMQDTYRTQKWREWGWFLTSEFGTRLDQTVDEKRKEAEEKASDESGQLSMTLGDNDKHKKAFEDFLKKGDGRYMTIGSPFYMEVKSKDGTVSVQAYLRPGQKDNGKMKDDMLSFLFLKTGSETVTLDFDKALKHDDISGHQIRIKEMHEWVIAARNHKPRVSIQFGRGCQEAIDFCHMPGMHESMSKVLQHQLDEIVKYQTLDVEVGRYEKQKLAQGVAIESLSNEAVSKVNDPGAIADFKDADTESILSEYDYLQRESTAIIDAVTKLEQRTQEVADFKTQIIKYEESPREAEPKFGAQIAKLDQVQHALEARRELLSQRVAAFKLAQGTDHDVSAIETQLTSAGTKLNTVGNTAIPAAGTEIAQALEGSKIRQKTPEEQERAKQHTERQEMKRHSV